MKDNYATGAMIIVATVGLLLVFSKLLKMRNEANRPPTPVLSGPSRI